MACLISLNVIAYNTIAVRMSQNYMEFLAVRKMDFLSIVQWKTTFMTSCLLPWFRKPFEDEGSILKLPLESKFSPFRDYPHLEGRQKKYRLPCMLLSELILLCPVDSHFLYVWQVTDSVNRTSSEIGITP